MALWQVTSWQERLCTDEFRYQVMQGGLEEKKGEILSHNFIITKKTKEWTLVRRWSGRPAAPLRSLRFPPNATQAEHRTLRLYQIS